MTSTPTFFTEPRSMLQKSPMYAYIPVKNLQRAREFYEQKLGFTRGREIAGGVHYDFGNGTACFMYPTPNAGTSRASQEIGRASCRERGERWVVGVSVKKKSRE